MSFFILRGDVTSFSELFFLIMSTFYSASSIPTLRELSLNWIFLILSQVHSNASTENTKTSNYDKCIEYQEPEYSTAQLMIEHVLAVRVEDDLHEEKYQVVTADT